MTGDRKLTWRNRLRSAELEEVEGAASSRICRLVSDYLAAEVPADQRVVVYDALPEEVNLSEVMSSHPTPHSRFAVTRTPDEGYALTVHPFGGPMKRHRYGYMQPCADAPQIDDGDIGAVLVPALGFDRTGNRLGRGKGYYDRFLARLTSTNRLQPDFLGIAGGHLVDKLPTDSHDVAMTHLVLPSGVWPVPVPGPALDGVALIH